MGRERVWLGSYSVRRLVMELLIPTVCIMEKTVSESGRIADSNAWGGESCDIEQK